MKSMLTKRLYCAIFCAALSLLTTTRAIAAPVGGDANLPQNTQIQQLNLENGGFSFSVSNVSPFGAVLTLPDQRDFKIFTLENPKRYVIDVFDTVMDGSQAGLDVNSDTVRSVRFGQFSRNPDIMRVVMDMAKSDQISIKGQENQIIFGQPAISTSKNSLPEPEINKYEEKVVITLNVPLPEDAIISQIRDPYRLLVDIPGYTPAEAMKNYPVDAGLVEGVRVSYFNNNPPTSRVVVDCKQPVEYRIQRENGSFSIVIMQPSLYGRTIVVDPGHGGKDDGTRSSEGDLEKDLNLVVAFKLAALLEAAGAKVIMTRKSDVFIPLGERAAIANRARADAFVSIHANALESHYRHLEKRGSQTYFYHDNSKPLAAIIHKQMTSSMGIGELGMLKARFKVLRETSMKAVLCELGYMTHPSDSSLLKVDEFRENAARGIFNGLNEYFGGQGALLPPLSLPDSAVAFLPGPSPAQMFASEHELPADLELDADEIAVNSRNIQPGYLETEKAPQPVSSGPGVQKSAPSRLVQDK